MLGNVSHFLLIIAAALGSTIGNSLFRSGLSKTGVESLGLDYLAKNLLSVVLQPLVFAGFVVYSISAVLWLRVLTAEPLNRAYPVLMGFVILFLIASSIIFLREPLTLTKISGMALIILGTFLVFIRM
ncbi:MAG: hypothetical protein AAB967_03410 [Patescibacteria group bacterium]|mgnify:FL=1